MESGSADPSIAYCVSEDSPRQKAVQNGHVGVARVMIELGADVNASPSYGWTALHFADGKIMVDTLVEAGANIEARNQGGLRPLNKTVGDRFGGPRIETARALVDHGADVNTRAENGFTPLLSLGPG